LGCALAHSTLGCKQQLPQLLPLPSSSQSSYPLSANSSQIGCAHPGTNESASCQEHVPSDTSVQGAITKNCKEVPPDSSYNWKQPCLYLPIQFVMPPPLCFFQWRIVLPRLQFGACCVCCNSNLKSLPRMYVNSVGRGALVQPVSQVTRWG